MPDTREGARELAGFWWLSLVTAVIWLIVSLVVLQFDQASITTIGSSRARRPVCHFFASADPDTRASR